MDGEDKALKVPLSNYSLNCSINDNAEDTTDQSDSKKFANQFGKTRNGHKEIQYLLC